MKRNLKNWHEFQALVGNLSDSERRSLQSQFPPGDGWIAFIRNSIGMSRNNLAKLKGSKVSTVLRDERQEKLGLLKLVKLDAYAKPLYSKLVWTFQPNPASSQVINQADLSNLTINQLTEIAEQQGSQFLYALLPIKSAEHIRIRHAIKVAKNIVKRVDDLMILENQALPPNKLKEHKKYFVEMILSQPSHKIWVVP